VSLISVCEARGATLHNCIFNLLMAAVREKSMAKQISVYCSEQHANNNVQSKNDDKVNDGLETMRYKSTGGVVVTVVAADFEVKSKAN